MTELPDLKPEIDFRDLIRKPENLFGSVYIYFLAAAVALGVLYVWNLTTIGKNMVMPVVLADSTALVRDIPLIAPSVVPPVDVKQAGLPSEPAIARGREVFRANCVSCHGDNGLGDGPTAATLNPKPRNFHSLQGWTNGSKVSQIYRTLQDGIVKNGMASYSYLPPADRFALAHYVRTFAPEQPRDSQEELQALEMSYQLSKGINSPGQIPIRMALRIVLQENATTAAAVEAIAARIESDADKTGAQLFQRVARDRRRAITSLVVRARPATGVDEFVRVVSADPIAFGLKPGVTSLPDQEWNLLFEYLTSLKEAVS